MRAVRAVALCLALTAPWLAPAAAGSGAACATAQGGAHAALILGTGSSTLTYCVALDGSTVTGIHLVQLAGAQYRLQYRLGFGGEAVCQLAGVGPSGGDCFADYPDFWGYWHGDGAGGWTWAGSGAGSSSVGDGDVEGWTWGSGDTGATHVAPPALAFDDVCDASPEPDPSPTPGGGSGGDGGGGGSSDHHGGTGGGAGTDSGDGGSGSSSPSSADEAGSSQDDGGSKGGKGLGENDSPAATLVPSPAATPTTELASGVTNEPSGGSPTGAVLALVFVAILGGAGWITMRRRARAERGPSGMDGER